MARFSPWPLLRVIGLLPLGRGLGSSSCGTGESLILVRGTNGDDVSIYMYKC